MLQQTGKSKKFFFYIILFLFLSTTQNLKIDNKISNLKNIKYIQVEGSNLKLNLSIENELKKLIDKNIFFLKKKNILREIDQFNIIEEISVKKIYPSQIIVLISETNLIAKTINNNNQFFIGSNGKLIGNKYIDNKIDLPNLFGNYDKDKFLNLFLLLKKLNFKTDQIKNIYYYPSGRWDIEILNSVIIRFPRENLKNAIKLSKKIIDNEQIKANLVIDLRIPNQVILNVNEI